MIETANVSLFLKHFTPEQSAWAKRVLEYGGLAKLPVKTRDPGELFPLEYNEGEIVGMFGQTTNLGNLHPKDKRLKWEVFRDEVRALANKFLGGVSLTTQDVEVVFSYVESLEYEDCRRARIAIKVKPGRTATLWVPGLHDSWWDEMGRYFKKDVDAQGKMWWKP